MGIVFTGTPVNAEKELFIRFALDVLQHTHLPQSKCSTGQLRVHSSLLRLSFI